MAVYEVPAIDLIPQAFTMSCWYASVQMLVNWRQNQAQASLEWLVPPELDAQCRTIRDANTGIQNSQIVAMAKRLGLQAVPPESPTVDALHNWLRVYGPLWVNGKTHIVVIAGIDTEALNVRVYDPAPVNKGRIEWRSLATWYAFGTSPSTRDADADVEAVFLYVPR
jgi:hypothetical protein